MQIALRLSGLKGENQEAFFAQERNLYCEAGNLSTQTREHMIWLRMESTPWKISAEELLYKNRLPQGQWQKLNFKSLCLPGKDYIHFLRRNSTVFLIFTYFT